jgi:membrane-bound metal-dependent hydrolase YbcI (DUF457 family)
MNSLLIATAIPFLYHIVFFHARLVLPLLKLKGTLSFKMLIAVYQTILHHILEDRQTNTMAESVSELYLLSDCRLSAKLVPTFVDRRVSCKCSGSPSAVISVF